MKAKIIQFFAAQVLAFLYGITPEQIAQAKAHVQIAEEKFSKTSDKWLFVKQGLQVLWPKVAASGINLAIELAVSFLKKKV